MSAAGAAAPFFFYGTLMDPAVLDAVVGRRVPAAARRPAAVAGYARVCRAGASYPILVPAADGRVEGIVVSGLGARDAARLTAFEGDDYHTAMLDARLRTGGVVAARAFLPRPGVPASPEPWLPDDWRRRHRARYLARLHGFGAGTPV